MADLYGVAIADALRGRPVRLPEPFDPDHLLWHAGEHGLHGLLEGAVSRRSDLPPALKSLEPRLKTLAMAQEAVVRVHLEAAREVAAALARGGVAAVFLKGAALAVEAYERPGLRPFSDLDLLVGAEDLERAAACLEREGFDRDRTLPASTMEVRYVRERRPAPPIGVDLHWDLVERGGPQEAVRVPVGAVLSRRRERGGIPVPSDEDAILLLAANLVRSRVDRMILLADLERLAARSPDWSEVVRRAGEWNLRVATWLGLQTARDVLGAAVPPGVLQRLRPPSWRTATLRRLLPSEWLWKRRKFKRLAWSRFFPYVCADSWPDALASAARRLWSTSV